MTTLLFLVGLAALFGGGEILVRGAVGIAHRLHLPPLVIGMTIVGFGTSMPELLVSLRAALTGSPAIALGNVVGSNTANILLILGLSALLFPIAARFVRLRRDLWIMIGATVLTGLLLIDDRLGRLDGLVLMLGLVGFLWLCLRSPVTEEDAAETPPSDGPWLSVGYALGGLLTLVAGARLLVDSATEIALAFGISEAVIGLTIVAVGTSLPELATSLVAALRRNSAIALGNVIGSNIFNLLGILGVTALVSPIPAEPRFAALDVPVTLGVSLLMLLMLWRWSGIGRIAGAVLLAAYAGYVAVMCAI